MARFEVSGIEGFQDRILKREAAATAAIPKMLKAGGAVVARVQREEISGTFNSSRTTGDLASSIASTNVKEEKGVKKVYVYPQGKNRRGQRNATVGFVLQYGRSRMPARPWFTRSNTKAAPEVQEAMRKEWEDETK